MPDIDLDAIEARAARVKQGPLTGPRCSDAMSLARTDVPALVALVRAKQSWIDGAKVDMDALEEAAAKATTWHMEALDDLAACVAERDEARERNADPYHDLRDAVLALCDAPDGAFMAAYVLVPRIREVVARVEQRGES